MVEIRNARFELVMRPSERALLNSAASAAGERPGTWARQVLIEAAKRELVAATD